MQHLFNEIEKIVTKNEKIIDLLRYILLFVASLMMYAKFSSFGNFDNTIVLTLIIIVFVLMMIKPLLGVLVLGLGLAITLAFSNVILGLMVLGLFLIMAFGLSYYDNDLIFVSLVMIMIASPFGFISAMALGMIAILFVQRGIGIPFIVSLFYVSFHLFDKRLFPLDLIHLNHETITLNDVLEKLNQVLVIDAAQNFDKAFIVFKENATLLIATVFIIYIAMRIIMTKKEKETVFQKELKNSVFSVSILTVSLLIVRIMAMLMLKKEIVMVDLLLDILSVLIGMLLAFMASCFIKRYPLSPVNPYEKVQEEKEKAKLMEVVKESDAKDLKYTWDSIAGYDSVKEELKEALEPYLDRKVKKEMEKAKIDPIKGLLLFGPPGVGKTLFAKVIASMSNMKIITCAGAEFTSKWVGESDKNLRNIFAKAKAIAPSIIFFDELESFLPRRDKANYNYEKTLVTTFLSQMDGFSELKDVLVIASTNYPDAIDPAAIRPGRFDKCIYIPEPDLKAKCAILEKYLGERTSFSKEDLTYVAQKMERFTAADIEGLVKEAYRQNKFMPLKREDLVTMITNYKPTITLDMRDHYEKIALKYTRSSFKSEAPKTKKKHYSWEDIAGMDDVKDKIKKLVEKPLIYADKYKEIGLDIPRGVLMYGPPGCGKTLFAKVIASECNAAFFVVNGPELLSKEVGESERKLREVFRSAREAKPAIIFFDEFDAIAENRALNMSSVKLINQLLTELDGMEELDGVIVIAATNRLEAIDPALRRPGRFDNTIYVGLPDNKSRQKQFEHYLNKLGSFDYEELALNSEGFSCADIEAMTRKIKELELDHLIQNEDKKITQEDCLKIIRDFKNNYQKN